MRWSSGGAFACHSFWKLEKDIGKDLDSKLDPMGKAQEPSKQWGFRPAFQMAVDDMLIKNQFGF